MKYITFFLSVIFLSGFLTITAVAQQTDLEESVSSLMGAGSWTRTGPININSSTGAYSLINDRSILASGNTVWAGSNGDGLYISTDGGNTWTNSSSGLPTDSQGKLFADVENLQGSFHPNRQPRLYTTHGDMTNLYRSDNGGGGWAKVTARGIPYVDTTTTSLFVANVEIGATPIEFPDKLWVSVSGYYSGIYHSTNNGVDWAPFNTGLPVTRCQFITGKSANSSDPEYVFTACKSATADVGSLYRSATTSPNWTSINRGLPANLEVNVIRAANDGTRRVYIGLSNVSTNGAVRVYRSDDAGNSWIPAGNGLPTNALVKDIVLDPRNSNIAYAALYSSGVYKTVDGGQNWVAFNNGNTTTSAQGIAAATNSSGQTLVHLGTQNGVWSIADSGAGGDTSSLSVNDVAVIEPISGTSTATFTVSLQSASTQTVTVDVVTSNNTAIAPGDYTPLPTTKLTFAPGETSKQVSVSINSDNVKEVLETFFVNLSNSTTASILRSQGKGQIQQQYTNYGRIVFVSTRDGNNEIYTMNSDGTDVVRITNNSSYDDYPSFSPDGSKIVFQSNRDGNYEIYMMNVDGSGLTRITNNSNNDTTPSFSPDGNKIVFVSDHGTTGVRAIYIMNSDGSGQTRLIQYNDLYMARLPLPSFSPDGSKIVFVRPDSNTNQQIHIMNADGTGLRKLTDTYGQNVTPSFSPDGSKILFHKEEGVGAGILLMNADGSNLTQVFEIFDSFIYPSFSPDGSKILFMSNPDGNMEFYTIKTDGTNITRLTNNTYWDIVPRWQNQVPYYNSVSGSSYRLTSVAKSWTEAETEAISLGGHLVAINNPEEQSFLENTLLRGEGLNRPYWIGLTDQVTEGVFRWTTGEPVNYSKWQPGEPNSAYTAGEDYVAMNWHHIFDNSPIGTWNDTQNSGTPDRTGVLKGPYYGIIEIPPPTQPPPTPNCTYTLNPNTVSATATGGSGSFDVTTQAGCQWNPSSTAGWISLGTTVTVMRDGSGKVNYTVEANTGAARSGTINIAGGQSFTVNQAAASLNYSCTPAPSGLTAWYRAENNANDSKGTNHGTIQPSTNGATFAPGKVGQALMFDGIDDQISISGSSTLNVGASNGMTVQMWINPSTLNNEKALAEWNNGNLGTHFWINTDGYGLKPGYIFANIVDTNGSYHFISTESSVVTANNFQHVALTYDKTTGEARLFHNGVVVKQLNLGIFTPQSSSAYNLYLGSRPGRSDSYYQGLMDEVQIFNRSLAQTEIQSIYNAGSSGMCSNTTPTGSGLQYYPLAYPIRLLDTRSGAPACYAPGVGFTGYETIKTQPATVTCQGLTIPSSAAAIVGTATALNTPQGGNLRLYPAGEQLAEVSNVNFVPGRTVSNSFTVKLGTSGAFNIYSYSPSDVIIDVTGYYAAPGTNGLYYHQLPNPIRILETRPGEAGYQTPGAPLSANSIRLQQAGNISYLGVTIPAAAKAITGNATVVNNGFASNGSLRLYPGDINQVVVTENINYVANQTIPNAFTARLDSSGRFNIHTNATTHVIIDVTGYYSTEPAIDQNGREGLLFNILPKPFRLLDTRAGFVACDAPATKLSAQTVRVQTVRGRTCSNQTVPSQAKAIFGNATVVNNFAGAGAGNIRLYPGEQPLANASNLNYVQGDVIPNSFIVGLGTTNGAMNIWSFSSTDFIVDVSGYFAAP